MNIIMNKQPILVRLLFCMVGIMLACMPQTAMAQQIARVSEAAMKAIDFESSAWSQASPVTDFKVYDPLSTQPTEAAEATEIRMLHDGKQLSIRLIAHDRNMARRDQPPLDEFADAYPQGDHAEVWINRGGIMLLAVDSVGNHYDALNFQRQFDAGLTVRTRELPDRWEAIITLPLASCFAREVGEHLDMSFVRHVDHDRSTESNHHTRSTPKGQRETSYIRFKLD